MSLPRDGQPALLVVSTAYLAVFHASLAVLWAHGVEVVTASSKVDADAVRAGAVALELDAARRKQLEELLEMLEMLEGSDGAPREPTPAELNRFVELARTIVALATTAIGQQGREVDSAPGTELRATQSFEADYFSWLQEQAALLRLGAVEALDRVNLRRILEDLVAEEADRFETALIERLAAMVAWWRLPELREADLELALRQHFYALERLLRRSPSLAAGLAQSVQGAWTAAVERAGRVYGAAGLPELCPFALDEVRADATPVGRLGAARELAELRGEAPAKEAPPRRRG